MVVNNSYDERLEIHENDNDITRCQDSRHGFRLINFYSLGAVDHQIAVRRIKSGLSLFNRTTAINARFLSMCFVKGISTLLSYV